MDKIKRFLCKESPGLLAAYVITFILVCVEFYLMGPTFLLICLCGVVMGAVLFGIGYVMHLGIKKLQLKCAENQDV